MRFLSWLVLLSFMLGCSAKWDGQVETFGDDEGETDVSRIKDEVLVAVSQSDCDALADEYCLLFESGCNVGWLEDASYENAFICADQLRFQQCGWSEGPRGINIDETRACVETFRRAASCERAANIAEVCQDNLFKGLTCEAWLPEGLSPVTVPKDAFVFDDFGQFDVRCFTLEEDENISIFTEPVEGSPVSDTILVLLNEAWDIVAFNDDGEDNLFAGIFDFVSPSDGTHYLMVVGYDAEQVGEVGVIFERNDR